MKLAISVPRPLSLLLSPIRAKEPEKTGNSNPVVNLCQMVAESCPYTFTDEESATNKTVTNIFIAKKRAYLYFIALFVLYVN